MFKDTSSEDSLPESPSSGSSKRFVRNEKDLVQEHGRIDLIRNLLTTTG
jgi:hypothetical protein